MKLLIILSVALGLCYVQCAIPRVDPLVLINQGLVKGRKATDGQYSSFLGIPYAQVNADNPFGESVAHPGFGDSIYNAYDGSIKCPQQDGSAPTGTLDCLRLNIYVPNDASSLNPLPVLVWIHGGAFKYGSAGDYLPQNLVKHGVVVVTVNYRLGPYGFLCLDDSSVPGNQGLKDQLAALRWIKENISSFGGNQYNITLGGQSAGASSTALHLYSTKEKLFQKVIIQSGVPQAEGMFLDGDKDAAVKLAVHLGMVTSDTSAALEFLSQTPQDLVVAAANEMGMSFGPCKENTFEGVDSFLQTDPYSLYNANKIKNMPILIGNTPYEMTGALDQVYGENYFKTDLFYNKIKNNFDLSEDEYGELSAIIQHFYLGDNTPSDAVRNEIEAFEADFKIIHPLQREIVKLLDQSANPIYQYVYAFHPDGGKATHSAELSYLFLDPSTVLTEDEQLLADRISTLWTNFVKYANPTPATSDLLPVTWTAVDQNSRPCLVIDKEISLGHRPFQERMAFWDLFYDIYGSQHKFIQN